MSSAPPPAASPLPVRALRLAFAVLTLTAIGVQLAIHAGAGYPVLNFFSYFTNLANLFAAAVLLRGAWDSSASRAASAEALRAASVVNMAVVGIVFAVLLRNVDLGSLRPWVNAVLHYVMPCAVVIDWLLQPPRARLGLRHLLLAQIFPLLYLGYVLVRGHGTGWYPYPFLDAAKVGSAAGVAAYAVGIWATFALAGWALLGLGRRARARLGA